MPVSTRLVAVAALTVAVAGLVTAYVLPLMKDDPFAQCRASAVAGGGAIGGPFTLTDEDGRSVTDRDVITGPTLIYFGFTFCPDLCPADLSRNAEATDILEELGHIVTPVFISVDPGRDTPAVLKEWTDAMHPRLVGLTGTPEQLQQTAKAYRTVFRVPEDKGDGFYSVDHMTHTYLMLPEIGFVEFFSRDETADALAQRAACFIEAAG